MNDFDYDVKQKKSIARGAYARKGGSKSKKCSLPSDLLTEAQKRKLNGPCDCVKLDKPMKWEQFKSLPLSLAKEYISSLRETYNPSQKMLADMFGVGQATVCRTLSLMGIGSGPAKRTDFGEETRIKQAKWDAFCHGVVGGKPEPEESNLISEAANDEVETSNDQIEIPAIEAGVVPMSVLKDVCRREAPVRVPASATSLYASFNGFPDLATLEQFYRLVGTDKIRVTINIEVNGGDAQ